MKLRDKRCETCANWAVDPDKIRSHSKEGRFKAEGKCGSKPLPKFFYIGGSSDEYWERYAITKGKLSGVTFNHEYCTDQYKPKEPK